MKRLLSLVLASIFVVATIATAVVHNLHKPKVLVLQSYGPDYAWTRDVDRGLRRGLEQNGHYSLRWHYMDLKRHPWPEAKERAGIQVRSVIDKWQPDLVIAIDDDAQQFAARHYVNRPDIKIVFAGVNGNVDAYGYEGASNVTGILERLPLQALKDALLEASPQRRKPWRMVEICDNSETVRRDHQFVAAFDWKPVIYTGAHLVATFPEWQKAVLAADQEADLILTTNYRQLRRSEEDRTLVPPREVIAWTMANTTLPVIGVNGFFVEDGGMLAIATSPFEQGEVAAAQAREILERGRLPSLIPHARSHQFVVLMRPGPMERFGLHLPEIYEAFARATDNYFPADMASPQWQPAKHRSPSREQERPVRKSTTG